MVAGVKVVELMVAAAWVAARLAAEAMVAEV